MYAKVRTLFARSRNVSEGKWESRIGGRPWGFPVEEWPHSPAGEPMVFIGQILLENLPETVYLFMMQTYNDECECINETFDLDQGLSAVKILARPGEGLTDGPHLQEISAIDWVEGWSYDFDNLDGNTDQQFELLDEEAEQDGFSETKIGGGARWIQGGSTPLPRDPTMRFLLSVSTDNFPQLENFFEIAFVFRSGGDPTTGAIVWECS